jgi:SAM-dependent methyltransferase
MQAEDWDERYRGRDYVWSTEPNLFLPGEVAGLAPGRALDLACGEGRNAVWLATQGWTVTGVDFSGAGLAKGARLAGEAGVEVRWVRADATTWEPDDAFDLVAVFYLQLPAPQRRAALGVAARALAPGGTLVVVAHDLSNLADGHGGPQDPTVLCTPDDVVADLTGTGVGVEVERAGTVGRTVTTDDGPRTAIDHLVRAHRTPA